jgi:hypothetical protein
MCPQSYTSSVDSELATLYRRRDVLCDLIRTFEKYQRISPIDGVPPDTVRAAQTCVRASAGSELAQKCT